MTRTTRDPRILRAAASAIRRLPEKARAAHLSELLLEMARRVEVEVGEGRERERGDVVDMSDVLNGRHG